MEKMKEKILKMVQDRQGIKPKEIINEISKNNHKVEIKAEEALRSMVVNGIVILNKHRKLVMPKNKNIRLN